MKTSLIEGRCAAATRRNRSYVVHYQKWDGEEELEFLEEARTPWELQNMSRYWWEHYGFVEIKVYDLFPGESGLQRTRRLRKDYTFHGVDTADAV